MIMKYITRILVTIMALTIVVGCFKDEKQGTSLWIALYSQATTDDEVVKTTADTDIEGYAFYVPKGSKWMVQSWQDALDRRIVNKDKPGEVRTNPDVTAVFDPEAEYQLKFELWSHTTFLVIVDHTNELYATRLYETPLNLPITYTQLHLYAWKKSGSVNGWDMVNPEEETPEVTE